MEPSSHSTLFWPIEPNDAWYDYRFFLLYMTERRSYNIDWLETKARSERTHSLFKEEDLC